MRVNGVHHLAISTADIKQQLQFFAEVLGTELVGLFEMHGVPGGIHAFCRLDDTSWLSFVQLPAMNDIESVIGVTHAGTGAGASAPGTMQHLAFRVDTLSDLHDIRDRIRLAGVNVIGEIDHGLCQSIYFAGPEGLTLEVACSDVPIAADVWIDPNVVAACGISDDELDALRQPHDPGGHGGSVPQPPIDPTKPHMAFPSDVYASIIGLPDAQLTASRSYTAPPGAMQ